MKIVQSLWSKPLLHKSKDGRYHGGWPSERLHAMSWALSVTKFLEFYNEIELVTDKKGYEFLIDKLKLPYTRVQVILDELEDKTPNLWALGKLKTYSIQEVPFIHVDSDVFIWGNVLKPFKNSDVVAQSRLNFTHSQGHLSMREFISTHYDHFPKEIQMNWSKNKTLYSANAGVCGGKKLSFFEELYSDALRFIRNTEKYADQLKSQWYNMMFEEHFIYCKAEFEKINIDYYLKDISHDFREVMNIGLLPNISKFIHLAGDAKKNKHSCRWIENRLKYENENLYITLDSIYPSSKNHFPPKTKWQDIYFRTTKILYHLDKNTSYTSLERIGSAVESYIKEEQYSNVINLLTNIYNLESKKYQLVNESLAYQQTLDATKFIEMKKLKKENILEQFYQISDQIEIVPLDCYVKNDLDSITKALSCPTPSEHTIFVLLYFEEGILQEEILTGFKQVLFFFKEANSALNVMDMMLENEFITLSSDFTRTDLFNLFTDFIGNFYAARGFLSLRKLKV